MGGLGGLLGIIKGGWFGGFGGGWLGGLLGVIGGGWFERFVGGFWVVGVCCT